MANSYYNHTTYPSPNAPGSSAALRLELAAIDDGFDKLPTLSGNAYKVAMINSGGTALVASSALQSLIITGSTINSTVIGASSAAAGTFTNLTATGSANLGSSVNIDGGTIDGTPIGGTTKSTGAFTTLSATSGYTGNVTGNVTGNLTGNVTGNVTASSGSSTFNNVTINGTLNMDAATVGTITNLATPTDAKDAAPKDYVDLRVLKSGDTMSGNLAMGTNKVTGVGDPTADQDAATKVYVDTADALKLNLSGGTMSGDIAMGDNLVTGLAAPSNDNDAARKVYVDDGLDLKLNLTGGTMSGAIAMGTNKITGMGDPTNAQDAATKAYVDAVAQSLDVKGSVVVATTANITLSGAQTIDGVAVVAGDRVLVKSQTAAADNGVYVVATGAWARASDCDTWAKLPGSFFFVEQGTTNDNSGWVCTVSQGGTLGTTSVTFEQFSGAGQITAGTGMTKSGNTLNVVSADAARIVTNADNIDLATTGVGAGTYKSVTVDVYGRVTAGTNPTTLSGYGITDAYTETEVDTALALKLNLSGGTMSGAIAMGTNQITGLGDPSLDQDAATKAYADLKLALTGGTMSGAIAMGTNKITGLGDPTADQDAATKVYVDGKLALTGGTMTGAIAMGSNAITGMADPTNAQDGATKNYIDTIFGSTESAAASAAAAAASAADSANSATASADSATASANSAAAAAASYDAFDDRYLGSKAADPTVDNDGDALLTGALYWNSTSNAMKIYDGSAWDLAYIPSAAYLLKAGGTMSGAIAMGTNAITGMADPTNAQDAATKAYVDAQVGANNELSEVLSNGNTTGGTDLVVSAGDTLTVDTINETTADNGVVIDGVTVKDGGINGVTVGTGAGSVSTNTAVGASALATNTTGASNTAVGEQSLTSNTTASYSTAVGAKALQDNTASSNTAVGYFAGGNNTTGTGNTFLGSSSGSTQTTGTSNTAIGASAGGAVTTGSNNVLIGESAGYQFTFDPANPPFTFITGITTTSGATIIGQDAGSFANGINTIVGYQSHRKNGVENATLGYQTLGFGYWHYGLATNSYNVAVGHKALRAANGVSNSVAVGHEALTAATTGDNNTAVGYHAGDSLTSGSNNIVIGYDADASSATVSNETTIGNASTTSARIFGDLKFLNSYTELVYTVSGTTPDLSPANGTIQTWTLTATSTPTAATAWDSGQSMTLMLDDGSAYSVDWSSLAVTWKTDGGVAPTLNATGYTVIVLWKVGSTIYGARVGDA